MRGLVSALAVLLLVSGCAEKVAGNAVEAKLFDPCTELSDDVLVEVGLDPATKVDFVQFSGWHMCGWLYSDLEDSGVNVYSTEYRLADFRVNPKKTGFRDVEIDGRSGMEYQEVRTRSSACTIGFDTARGSVHVEVSALGVATPGLCDRAREQARLLLPYLPE